MKKYDIIIVGGGISGIYTMYNLKKKYPKLKVLLVEKEDRFGGRVYTYHERIDNKIYQMDLGAGRIGFHHNLMIDLINERENNPDVNYRVKIAEAYNTLLGSFNEVREDMFQFKNELDLE